MKPAILVPAILAPGALDEFKNWLGITTLQEDASLLALLRSALDMCESFTRQMPLEATAEEILAASTGWQKLATRPVHSVSDVELVANDGTRSTLAVGQYEIDLDADGGASVRLLERGIEGRIAVLFIAGLAANWNALPDGLRHGIIRLAAHNYRQRDLDAMRPVPPAAVAAMWSPWRRLMLA